MKTLVACIAVMLTAATAPAFAEDGHDNTSFRIVVNSDIAPVAHGDYRYPVNAARRGLDGACEVEFVISRTGKTDAIRIRSCSSELFKGAAKQVVKTMAFSPSPTVKQNVVANIRWDFAEQSGR